MASFPFGDGLPFFAPGRGLPREVSPLEPGPRGLNPAPLRRGAGKWGAPHSAAKVAARSLEWRGHRHPGTPQARRRGGPRRPSPSLGPAVRGRTGKAVASA